MWCKHLKSTLPAHFQDSNSINTGSDLAVQWVCRHLHPSYLQFCNGWTNIPSHKRCKRLFFPPHPCQHVFLFVSLIIDVLIHLKWISLRFWFPFPDDSLYWALFHMLLAVCVSSLEKCQFRLFANFLIWLLILFLVLCFLLSSMSSLFWILSKTYPIYGCKYFSLFRRLPLLLCWWFPLLCRSFLVWCSPTCWCLLPELLVSYSKCYFQGQCQGAFPLGYLLEFF